MSLSSSWVAWPETWTKAMSSHSTSAPRRRSGLMTRLIVRSWPGMTRAERITRSPAPDLEVLVLAGRHEGQRRVRLALAAGGEDHLAIGRQRRQLLEREERPLGDAEIAELRGQAHVGLHAPPEERDPAPERGGEVEDLLDPVDVRGEGGQDDAAGGAAEPLGQRAPDLGLGGRGPGPVDVRRVGHQAEDAPLPELGEPVIVGALAVDRLGVELEVPRVDDRADRRLDPVADPVHDRVRHADRLDPEAADVERPGAARPARAGRGPGARARGGARRPGPAPSAARRPARRARAAGTAARRCGPRARASGPPRGRARAWPGGTRSRGSRSRCPAARRPGT